MKADLVVWPGIDIDPDNSTADVVSPPYLSLTSNVVLNLHAEFQP